MASKQTEIPGTEPPRITAIENAAEEYVRIRDRRMRLTTEEVAARENLINVVKKNADKLTPNGDGELHYRYDDDMLVVLSPGKEKVKVKHANSVNEGD